MASGGRHHPLPSGKGSGAGAMTDLAKDKVEETRLCQDRA